MNEGTLCACSRSVAAVCALFAGLGAGTYLAARACREAGGAVSDQAWICEYATGAAASLWSLVPPLTAILAGLAVGIPVFLAVDALVDRALLRLAASRRNASRRNGSH